jgi:ATP synthase I chain
MGADPAGGQPTIGDATMRVVIKYVAGSAAVMTVVALLSFGPRTALGVGLGGAIATVNLYAFARIVDAFLSRRGRTAPWTVIAVLKLVALLGGVWLILRSGLASGASLVVGYASLVVGMTLGTLFGPKPDDEPPAGPSDPG